MTGLNCAIINNPAASYEVLMGRLAPNNVKPNSIQPPCWTSACSLSTNLHNPLRRKQREIEPAEIKSWPAPG
jgi:hypothetical protein